MDTQKTRILIAEILGTCVLMLGGPGSAIFAFSFIDNAGLGLLGVSLGFGFSLAIMAYVIGPISGCHINPAVTLGMLISKKIDTAHAAMAVVGQLIGAVLGGGIIKIIVSSADIDRPGFASNGYEKEFGFMGLGAAAIIEIVLTALLVIVVLATTTKGFAPGLSTSETGWAIVCIPSARVPRFCTRLVEAHMIQ